MMVLTRKSIDLKGVISNDRDRINNRVLFFDESYPEISSQKNSTGFV